MKYLLRRALAAGLVGFAFCAAGAQRPATVPVQKIFLDTDIGDDIDDAFALVLALKSPGLQIAGISSAWGDTALRARMIERNAAGERARGDSGGRWRGDTRSDDLFAEGVGAGRAGAELSRWNRAAA